jgi:catechol 2,3-dioxygenase-like lactoylglutathione lyase family enzyme
MKFRFGEINVVCTERERSLAFYRDVLGFEVVGEEGTAVHLRGVGLAFLLLPEASEVSPAVAYGTRATLSFDLIVEDLSQAQTYFQGHDVPCEGDPSAGFFVVRDPDGLCIEIVQA